MEYNANRPLPRILFTDRGNLFAAAAWYASMTNYRDRVTEFGVTPGMGNERLILVRRNDDDRQARSFIAFRLIVVPQRHSLGV
jgi:hypothetical protein